MDQILIVEDDRALNHGLCMALREEGRRIVSCENARKAREQMCLDAPALAILDVSLPDGSGLELLRAWKRELPLLPVILLTANDTDAEIVEGLELGADDYVTKPFSLSVLRARVRAQLRRAGVQEAGQTEPDRAGYAGAGMSGDERTYAGRTGRESGAPEAVYRNERFSFDFTRMRFAADGRDVELSRTEQRLLRLLTAAEGATVSRASLVDRIWTDGAEYVDENALSVAVKRLRDKLGAQDAIRTVYGIGYAWTG